MKIKFAAIALIALAFSNTIFAAGEHGVEMALLNDNPNPAVNDRKHYRAYEEGPAPLAISFMTQFYDVPAEAVSVKVIERKGLSATVEAKAAGHTCTMGMVPAPSGVVAKHGWLSSSMKCDS